MSEYGLCPSGSISWRSRLDVCHADWRLWPEKSPRPFRILDFWMFVKRVDKRDLFILEHVDGTQLQVKPSTKPGPLICFQPLWCDATFKIWSRHAGEEMHTWLRTSRRNIHLQTASSHLRQTELLFSLFVCFLHIICFCFWYWGVSRPTGSRK